MDGEMDVKLEKDENSLSQEAKRWLGNGVQIDETHGEKGMKRIDHFIARTWKNSRMLHHEYGMTCQALTAPGKWTKTFDLSTRS
jgi:hypothetical protein